ncbi:hypothetical protein D3C75_1306290 [compost metagenome]
MGLLGKAHGQQCLLQPIGQLAQRSRGLLRLEHQHVCPRPDLELIEQQAQGGIRARQVVHRSANRRYLRCIHIA